MKEGVVAAITTAISTYIQQEEQAKIVSSSVTVYPEISTWRLFGRQELMRARIHWRVKRTDR